MRQERNDFDEFRGEWFLGLSFHGRILGALRAHNLLFQKRERARESIDSSLMRRDIRPLNRQTVEHRRISTEAKEIECEKETLLSDMHKEINQQRHYGRTKSA